MIKLILLFNHTLTNAQEEDARASLEVEEIITPPRPVRELWQQIPPDAAAIAPLLTPVHDWLDNIADNGDYVLIQGDFGACFITVRHVISRGLIPVYSTTSRMAVEKRLDDGTVELAHTFRHVRFRRYGE